MLDHGVYTAQGKFSASGVVNKVFAEDRKSKFPGVLYPSKLSGRVEIRVHTASCVSPFGDGTRHLKGTVADSNLS